jgi:hypothetical protein
MNGTIDTEALKARWDLRDLAARHSRLRRESQTEASGPCPRCGGKDRFHVRADMFFCRACYPLGNGKPHDAIAFVQWAGLAHDFLSATTWLGAEVGTAHHKPAARAPAAPAWQAESWQAMARRELAEAVARLASPAGAAGRAYLESRGLRRETWEAWGAGYGPAWDGKLKRKRPAVLLPWRGRRITGIKYRFADDAAGGLRYTSKGGGQCLLFGLHRAGQHYDTLFLCEGELNALSIWQALKESQSVDFDVLSFGAEDGARSAYAAALAAKYRHTILWLDQSAKTAEALVVMPDALGIGSPVHDGVKLDGNALLQAGLLSAFLAEVWDRAREAALHRIRNGGGNAAQQ